MKVFITGGCKNGKSSYACRIANVLAGKGPKYYVATMLPWNEEDHERIRYHVEKRSGMDFETLEVPVDLENCLEMADPKGTFLIDSVTALLLNEMFRNHSEEKTDPFAVSRCVNGLDRLCRKAENVVFVSDYIYSDAEKYNEYTEEYRRALAEIDSWLAAHCDQVIDICAANSIVMMQDDPIRKKTDGMQLLIGGSYQGKLEFAKKQYGFADYEIYTFDENIPFTEDTFSYPCINHIEEFVKYCIQNKMDPIRTLVKYKESWKQSVLICTDIFCGVVQTDPFTRYWREQTGHVCAYLASKAESVLRIFCGLPQTLK